jgi:hypothetical protein
VPLNGPVPKTLRMLAPLQAQPNQESFIGDMKRYLHFREDDAILLRNLGPRMER